MDIYYNRNKIGNVELFAVDGDENRIAQIARVCRGVDPFDERYSETVNAQLVERLFTLKHFRPFEFCSVSILFNAPIFVERQIRTYRKPDIERSLRCCSPLKCLPTGNETIDKQNQSAFDCYYSLINQGVTKEEARRVLPLDSPTNWISQFNLRSLIHFFEERLNKAAQGETRQFAAGILELIKPYFPTIAEIVNKRTE